MPDSLVRETHAPRRHSREEPVLEYLTFSVNGEAFGVPLKEVQEILGVRMLTRVPRSPREVLGVCTVRGELVTVLDTGLRLQPRAEPSKGAGRILLANTEAGEKVGLMVDVVLGVRRFLDSEIESTAGSLVGDISSHIESIGRQTGTMTVLVNLASLIGSRPEERG